MGKVKLTLSVNEQAVARARYHARRQGKTLSALFEEKAAELARGAAVDTGQLLKEHPGMEDLVGVFKAGKAFDERSAHYRKKHG